MLCSGGEAGAGDAAPIGAGRSPGSSTRGWRDLHVTVTTHARARTEAANELDIMWFPKISAGHAHSSALPSAEASAGRPEGQRRSGAVHVGPCT